MVLVSRASVLTPKRLEEAVVNHGVTTAFFTTSLFNKIVSSDQHILRHFKEILIGGEEVSPQFVGDFLKQDPSIQLRNAYGPTEAVTFSVSYPINAVAPQQRRIPIGRPIANTQVYVLDGRLQPVPVGVAGELFIAGDGLARGYLNRPELTAERFLDNSFSPGSRMYRTGDRVRWRADGQLEFLGRTDDQVKIRGHRIELGEVEARLLGHAEVRAAAVVVHGEGEDKRLVGYYTLKDPDAELEAQVLRDHLVRDPGSRARRPPRQLLRPRRTLPHGRAGHCID